MSLYSVASAAKSWGEGGLLLAGGRLKVGPSAAKKRKSSVPAGGVVQVLARPASRSNPCRGISTSGQSSRAISPAAAARTARTAGLPVLQRLQPGEHRNWEVSGGAAQRPPRLLLDSMLCAETH
jgi:hypothetical protein